MSARDRLDSYERDWERHLNWRNPPNHEGGVKPGHYITESSGFGRAEPAVAFREMPSDLRERVAKRLESVVARLVDEEHAKLLNELRVSARVEAMDTLEELKDVPVTPSEASFIETGVAP